MVFVKYIWFLSNIFQLIENKIPDWKIVSSNGKKYFWFKTANWSEMIWQKIFILNKYVNAVWKIDAYGKYIYSLKKYMPIESIFDVFKNIF